MKYFIYIAIFAVVGYMVYNVYKNKPKQTPPTKTQPGEPAQEPVLTKPVTANGSIFDNPDPIIKPAV